MPWVPEHIRRTFPVPKREIRRRKWRLALCSPLSWTPLLPALVLTADPSAKVVGLAIAAGLGILGGVVLFWQRRSRALEARIVEELVRESNLAQDSALIQLIRRLSRHGYESFAVTLGSFAGLKTKIERALYHGGEHTPDKQQVGRLIDDLVFHVVDQLEDMAKIEYRLNHEGRPAPPPEHERQLRARWTEMSERVRHAYDALLDAWHNLDALVDPLPPHDISGERLDDTVGDLRDEIRIADEIRKRLQGGSADALAPLEAAADAEIEAAFATGAEEPD